MPPLVLALVVFGSVVVVVVALTAPSESVLQERLRAYGYTLGNRNLAAPFTDRVIFPIIGKFASLARYFSPRMLEEDLRRRLAQAGNPAGFDATTFLAVKALAFVALPALVLVVPLLNGRVDLRSIVLAIVVAVLGWKLPDLWLSGRVSARQRQIERGLPDALDLIVVCVEAGNSLEAAMANVTIKLRGPLGEEFDRTLREISLGKPRRDALRDLGKRTGVADLQSFLAAILQADQLGVSIAHVLRVQADAMRVRRRQRAEEQAAKVPVKMLLPLVGLIFPAIFIVVAGPVGLRLVRFFASMGAGPGFGQ